MPQNHAGSLREPLSRRARMVTVGLIGTVVVVVVLILALGSSNRPKPGCIHVDLAGAMGAVGLDECGASARHTCATARAGAATYSAVGVLNVERACRSSRLPVG